MRRIIIAAFLTFAFLLLPSNGLAGPKTNRTSSTNQLVIRGVEGGWGDADVKDIEVVLASTAKELLKYFPNKRLQIRVEHGESPITLYRKSSAGEYVVRLSVEGTYWAQLAYQFITWKTSAPYSSRKSYAPSLRKYADNEMSKRGRQLPYNMTLARWHKENESDLKSEDVDSPEARNKQFVVASKLLPIFEQNPDLWESVSYLSVKKTDSSYLQNYLNNWYRSAPEEHKSLIREISYLFRE